MKTHYSILKKIRQAMPIYIRNKFPRKIVIVAISAQKSQNINWEFRKKEKPANVLSFYYGPEYGEILICPEIIRCEAKEQGNFYHYQMTWMILHGMIHLSGRHHEISQVITKTVVTLEQRILAKVFKKAKFSMKKFSNTFEN